jgi:archaellum biogenesis ATPase FlaH
MKKLLTLLLVISTLTVFSQKIDTCFTQPELINIANNIKQLQYQDSIKNEIIIRQDSSLVDYKEVVRKDSLIIASDSLSFLIYRENEVNYKEIINDYKKMSVIEKVLYVTYGIIPGVIIGAILIR